MSFGGIRKTLIIYYLLTVFILQLFSVKKVCGVVMCGEWDRMGKEALQVFMKILTWCESSLLKKTTKVFSRGSPCHGGDSKWRPPEYRSAHYLAQGCPTQNEPKATIGNTTQVGSSKHYTYNEIIIHIADFD
jgi:hypothetical protein